MDDQISAVFTKKVYQFCSVVIPRQYVSLWNLSFQSDVCTDDTCSTWDISKMKCSNAEAYYDDAHPVEDVASVQSVVSGSAVWAAGLLTTRTGMFRICILNTSPTRRRPEKFEIKCRKFSCFLAI